MYNLFFIIISSPVFFILKQKKISSVKAVHKIFEYKCKKIELILILFFTLIPNSQKKK